MAYDLLRERVCFANQEICRLGLSILTWGNVSEVDRESGVFAIKPSGVSFDDLSPEDMVVVSVESGEVVEGALNPSSDVATHGALYRSFLEVGGVAHSHALCSVAWAQAGRGIPCLGTTHADVFYGEVPCTRALRREEVEVDYELNTGRVIVECFTELGLCPLEVPGVLVAAHGPFTWGKDAAEAVVNGLVLEEVAKMGEATLGLNPEAGAVDSFLLDRHFLRKHGSSATYGQG